MEINLNKPLRIITPEPLSYREYFTELWRNRHILIALYNRNIKQQYVQTKLGIAWAVLKPGIIVLVFTILFSWFIKIKAGDYPYALFALSGLIAWNLFSIVFNSGSQAVKTNAEIIKKKSIPLLLFPILTVADALNDWVISFILMLLLMLFLGYLPHLSIVLLPLVLAVNVLLAFGSAVWLCLLNIRFKDINQFVPYLVNFSIWLTPVFFPVTIIPEPYGWIININPMTGILNMYRYILFGETLNITACLWSCFLAITLTVSSIHIFILKEGEMIDNL